MPIFQCQTCGVVENTSCCDYWSRVLVQGLSPTCSKCQTGRWHGLFPREDAAAAGYMLGADGRLYGPEERPHHTTIVGPVPPLPTPPEPA